MFKRFVFRFMLVLLVLSACNTTGTTACPTWSGLDGNCQIKAYQTSSNALDMDLNKFQAVKFITTDSDAVITEAVNVAIYNEDGAEVDLNTKLHPGTYVAKKIDTAKPASWKVVNTNTWYSMDIDVEYVKKTK